MTQELQIRSLSGSIHFHPNGSARVLIPRSEFVGCTPPRPVFPGPSPVRFNTPHGSEVREFLKWFEDEFFPVLKLQSLKRVTYALEPFLFGDLKLTPKPVHYANVPLNLNFRKDGKSNPFNMSGISADIHSAWHVGELANRSNKILIGKKFGCDICVHEDSLDIEERELSKDEQLRERIKVIELWGLYSDQIILTELTNEDVRQFENCVSDFLYHYEDGKYVAMIMERFNAALHGNGLQSDDVMVITRVDGAVLLSKYLMWSVLNVVRSIVMSILFGEFVHAENLKRVLKSFNDGVWPLGFLQYKTCTTFLLLIP